MKKRIIGEEEESESGGRDASKMRRRGIKINRWPFVFFSSLSLFTAAVTGPTSTEQKQRAKEARDSASPCSLSLLSSLYLCALPAMAHAAVLYLENFVESASSFLCSPTTNLFSGRSDIFSPPSCKIHISTSFPFSSLFLISQASATSQPSSVGFWRPFVTSTSGALVSCWLISRRREREREKD